MWKPEVSTLTGGLWCLHSSSSLQRADKVSTNPPAMCSVHHSTQMYLCIILLLFKWKTLPCCFRIFPFTSSCLWCADPLKPQYERWVEKIKSSALVPLASTDLSLGSGLYCRRTSPESRPASFSSQPLWLLPPREVHCGLLKTTGRPPCITPRSLSQSGRSGGQGRVGGAWESAKCSSGLMLLGEEGKTLRKWPRPRFWPRIKNNPWADHNNNADPPVRSAAQPENRRSQTALIVYAKITRIQQATTSGGCWCSVCNNLTQTLHFFKVLNCKKWKVYMPGHMIDSLQWRKKTWFCANYFI